MNLNTRNNTSFGAIKIDLVAEGVISRKLKSNEWTKLNKLVTERAKDKHVDLFLYSNDKCDGLIGRIRPKYLGEIFPEKFSVKDHKQGLFQSIISFVEKMNNKTAKCESEVELLNKSNLEINNIFEKTKF